MPVRRRERLVAASIHGPRRRHVQQHRPDHPLRGIHAQLVRDAGAAVVPADVEALVAQGAHDGGAVGGHGPLAVGRVRGAGGGL